MIHFENQFFQKITFSQEQIRQFVDSASKDIKIASDSDVPEVVFKFSYDAFKIGLAAIADRGYKVRSQAGPHIKIIEKLSQIIEDEDVIILGNRMRQERNADLYLGGSDISEKESQAYLDFVQKVVFRIQNK